ncbi:terminase [Lacticaseibacillus pabuli]|uniref:Terminase n=1 Tax=Lacticaseibacillus pabuli TaxID=3025672 RepID=A0ABY7WV00_9LACO|nr:terminase [Lacticaseibacillus sp. KACC 23028]WDF83621.1 terminase [Lacticaseibacillus sp. KACC 23028]
MAKGKYQQWLTEEGLTKLAGWARQGLTDEQIAHNMGITPRTLYKWKTAHGQIGQALIKEKEVVDFEVENALFKRAIGASYTVDKTYTLIEIDPETLALNRKKYSNQYKLDHPEATEEEIKDTTIEHIPAQQKIQTAEYVKQQPADVTAQQFWLRNRKPKQYRDQSFASLNEAQAEKAKQDARKARAEADMAEAKAKAYRKPDGEAGGLNAILAAIDTSAEEAKHGDD